MVGPNFKSPAAPVIQSYDQKPLPHKTASAPHIGKAGHAQIFAVNMDIPGKWWYLFRSPALNHLIKTGLENNPSLSAAYASLRMSQEALNAQIGNSLFPAFDASLAATRQQTAGIIVNTTPNSIFNIFGASVNVSYTLDFFGGARRQIESLVAQVDYQQFLLIAAHLTLTSNIVTTTITVASLQAQIDATNALIHAQEQQLTILKKQFKLGAISNESVFAQQTLLEQTRASLPTLQKNLSQTRHALSALIGRYPSNPLPPIKLDELHLPVYLPISLPSHLVRQRPDVRAQEALLHAASAQIGVATANLLPQFNVTGNYGWEAPVASQLFSTHSNVWNIASQLTQPLFHGGALFATRRQAIAAYDEAHAQYRQVVLQAFQNVSDTLRALETDARTLRAQRLAEIAARRSLRLTQNQYTLGGTSYLFVLKAQAAYQTAKISRIQAEAIRYADTAALFQALGGGWWHTSWCVKECLNTT